MPIRPDSPVKVHSDGESLALVASFAGVEVRFVLPDDVVNEIIITGGRYFISPQADGRLEIHEEYCGLLPDMVGTQTVDGVLDGVLDVASYEAKFTDPPPSDWKPNKHPRDIQHFAALEKCLERWLKRTREEIQGYEVEKLLIPEKTCPNPSR